jgi:hypothetical protein
VKQIKKLNYLMLKLNTMKGERGTIENQEAYYRKIVERTSVKKKNPE